MYNNRHRIKDLQMKKLLFAILLLAPISASAASFMDCRKLDNDGPNYSVYRCTYGDAECLTLNDNRTGRIVRSNCANITTLSGKYIW